MATVKTSALTELNETPADSDELIVVDKSDTTDAASGTTKKISASNLIGNKMRTATKIVAASDSLNTTHADYVCDGTADEVEINQAMTAIAATGGTVLLMEGTYNITSSISFPAGNITLAGQGYSTKITTATASIKIIENPSGSWYNNVVVRDLRIVGTTGTYGIYLYQSRDSLIENCNIESCGNIAIYLRMAGTTRIVGNRLISNTGSQTIYVFDETEYIIANNFFESNTGSVGLYLGSVTDTIVTGNRFAGNTSGAKVIQSSGANVTISNNSIKNTNLGTSYGIYLSGSGSIATGNTLTYCGTGIWIAGKSAAVGNNFYNNNNSVEVAGTGAQVYGNGLESPTEVNRTLTMTNTTASSVTAGTVVVYDSTAAGDEFTTTTTAGDNKVVGVIGGTILSSGSGAVIVAGKTAALKVNGTDAIAVGDFLATYTEAGIAAKASSGHTAFAIALEAYSTADSSGVIDALIVSPRVI